MTTSLKTQLAPEFASFVATRPVSPRYAANRAYYLEAFTDWLSEDTGKLPLVQLILSTPRLADAMNVIGELFDEFVTSGVDEKGDRLYAKVDEAYVCWSSHTNNGTLNSYLESCRMSDVSPAEAVLWAVRRNREASVPVAEELLVGAADGFSIDVYEPNY